MLSQKGHLLIQRSGFQAVHIHWIAFRVQVLQEVRFKNNFFLDRSRKKTKDENAKEMKALMFTYLLFLAEYWI